MRRQCWRSVKTRSGSPGTAADRAGHACKVETPHYRRVQHARRGLSEACADSAGCDGATDELDHERARGRGYDAQDRDFWLCSITFTCPRKNPNTVIPTA